MVNFYCISDKSTVHFSFPQTQCQVSAHAYCNQYVICPKKVGGRVCEYVHAKAIYNVLAVQTGGSTPQQIKP